MYISIIFKNDKSIIMYEHKIYLAIEKKNIYVGFSSVSLVI